jgi:hypothetical protein
MAIAQIGSAKNEAENGTAQSSLTCGLGGGTQSFNAGDLIVVMGSVGVNYTWLAGNCTKSSGTATIETPSLARQQPNASGPCAVAVWTAKVTATGTVTMQITGAGSTQYYMAVDAFSGNFDTGANRTEATNSSTGSSTAESSGSATSVGAALFLGGFAEFLNGSTTHTAGGTYTLSNEEGNGASFMTGALEFSIVSTGTSKVADATIANSAQWTAVVAVLKEIVTILVPGYYM